MNAIHQTEKHPKLSPKYNLVNTQGVMDRFAKHGFKVRDVLFAGVRNESSLGFQKHLVRLWQPENFKAGGTEYPEIVLINSHNGSTSVQLNIGIYRLICSNGLVIGDTFDIKRVRHVGFTYEKLDDAIAATVKRFPAIVQNIADLKAFKLNPEQIYKLGRFTANLRVVESPNESITANILKLIQPTRNEDQEKSAWNVLNILQEKMINGGIEYTREYRDPKTELLVSKRNTTRPLKSIDSRVSLNKALFSEVMRLAA